jgi:hypothetical protein
MGFTAVNYILQPANPLIARLASNNMQPGMKVDKHRYLMSYAVDAKKCCAGLTKFLMPRRSEHKHPISAGHHAGL